MVRILAQGVLKAVPSSNLVAGSGKVVGLIPTRDQFVCMNKLVGRGPGCIFISKYVYPYNSSSVMLSLVLDNHV